MARTTKSEYDPDADADALADFGYEPAESDDTCDFGDEAILETASAPDELETTYPPAKTAGASAPGETETS